jgi:hypothetical protein
MRNNDTVPNDDDSVLLETFCRGVPTAGSYLVRECGRASSLE